MLRALLFDLGDTIMQEETEVKNEDEEVGVSKPDPRMFLKALDELGIAEKERAHVLMVGNNLSRDIRGANALGLRSVWIHHNERYPIEPADEFEQPAYSVRSSGELQILLESFASPGFTVSISEGKEEIV